MEYKEIQKTKIARFNNFIHAYRILDIQGDHLIFQMNPNTDERSYIKVSMPETYKIGDYIDLVIERMSRTSHRVTFIGRTPEEFAPAVGENIS